MPDRMERRAGPPVFIQQYGMLISNRYNSAAKNEMLGSSNQQQAQGLINQLSKHPIEQPSLQQCADELAKFISELESHLDAIDGSLYGKAHENPCNAPVPESVQAKIADACTRVSNMCGQASTIIRDLGQ